MQAFLRAACKALEAVDVVSHKTEFGKELGHKAADKNLPEEMRARAPPQPLALHILPRPSTVFASHARWGNSTAPHGLLMNLQGGSNLMNKQKPPQVANTSFCKLLNRLLAVKVDMQCQIFDYFTAFQVCLAFETCASLQRSCRACKELSRLVTVARRSGTCARPSATAATSPPASPSPAATSSTSGTRCALPAAHACTGWLSRRPSMHACMCSPCCAAVRAEDKRLQRMTRRG